MTPKKKRRDYIYKVKKSYKRNLCLKLDTFQTRKCGRFEHGKEKKYKKEQRRKDCSDKKERDVICQVVVYLVVTHHYPHAISFIL